MSWGCLQNASYRRYVDLGRRYVVWNVVATPELSLEPRRWCFPVAGCLSYRGYFSESAATEYAEVLEFRGLGCDGGWGPARTRRWGGFDDPLLSSMVEVPEYFLAGIVFHELAHQRLYVPGDTEFNESFAVVVERAGVTPMDRVGGTGRVRRTLPRRGRTAGSVPGSGEGHAPRPRGRICVFPTGGGEAQGEDAPDRASADTVWRAPGHLGERARPGTSGSSAG